MGTVKSFLYVSLPSYRLIDLFSLGAAPTLRNRVDVTHGITETFQYNPFAEDVDVNDEETWEIRLKTVQSLLPVETAAYLIARFYVHRQGGRCGRLGAPYRRGNIGDFLSQFHRFQHHWRISQEMEQLAENGSVGMSEGQIVNIAIGLVKLSIKAPGPRPD